MSSVFASKLGFGIGLKLGINLVRIMQLSQAYQGAKTLFNDQRTLASKRIKMNIWARRNNNVCQRLYSL